MKELFFVYGDIELGKLVKLAYQQQIDQACLGEALKGEDRGIADRFALKAVILKNREN